MRHLISVASLLVLAGCAGKSTALHAAGSGASGAGGVSESAGYGAHGAAASGAGATGAAGAAGAAAVSGTGGTSPQAGHDAGSGGAGNGGAGAAGQAGAVELAGSGGKSGAGGSAAESCSKLEADYSMARDTAQMCDPRASEQCQHVVAASLGCHCTIHVNDSSTLNDIQGRYDRAGCPTNTCAGVLCVNPGTGACTSIDRGDVCQ